MEDNGISVFLTISAHLWASRCNLQGKSNRERIGERKRKGERGRKGQRGNEEGQRGERKKFTSNFLLHGGGKALKKKKLW